ncbi:hypothetical protein M9458_023704, partial [Cirrhinus mrigala]
TCAVAKLNIDWPAEEKAAPQKSKLNERFLRSKPPSPRRSLPFFPNFHTEISRSWARPFSARLFVPASDYYGNVAGLDERAYKAMPRVEQTLASYLSPGAASSLKAPTLPSKPLRTTSALVGKGYTAAGQAGACLHTMSVLQAYQADLLKRASRGTADLALRATKETAEQHLWLMLSDMKEKDRVFLLDAPLEPSGLFGDAVDSVFSRYQEACKQAAAFQWFLPRRSLASAAAGRDSSYREVQKLSVATRAPPSRDRDQRPNLTRQIGPVAIPVPQRAAPTGEERVAPHYTVSEVSLPPLPELQGAAASGKRTSRISPPEDVAEPGRLSPPRGSLEQLVQQSPAGPPLQSTPEASLERLLLPNVSAWVLRTVEKGYSIQFGAPPPSFDGVFPTLVGPEQALVMEQEVETLLRKEAIEVVPPHDRESGFYSRYFIVPKKDGGLRPIIDLHSLNRSFMRLKFKMLTVKQVVSQIRSEDWFVTIDLKDVYFHVSILPQHRKFLRFAFRGEASQYRVLPFGLVLSPRTFTKCVDAALVPLRLQGICILNYIDDWLILAESESLAAWHRDVVLAHMKTLGLRLNAKKIVLSPLQRTTYLGVVWDSTTMQARLSPAWIESILTAVTRVKEGWSLTVKQFQQLLGLMAAASNVIPFGLLYMRPLQWWIKTKGFSPRGNPLCMIKVTHVEETLVPKSGPGAGSSLRIPRPSWHINCLEMLAVFQALKYFLPDLRDRRVLVRTNNTAVVYYINHQGVHVPGHLNVGADVLSRQGPRPGEWMLHPEVVKQIWKVFGPAQVDLFATRENAQFHPAPLGLDVMVQVWPRLRLYTFPPIALLLGVLERVRRDGVSVLMVLGPDLLSQAGGTILHPRLELWKLWLIASGLSTEVVETILQKLYALNKTQLTAQFLQAHFSTGLSHSTLKVYVAAISAYHAPLGGLSVGKDPLVVRFLRGYDLPSPCGTWLPPFKPIEEISVRFLTIKTALLLALTSLKRVGDLQALSVAPSYLEFAPGMTKAFLYPKAG